MFLKSFILCYLALVDIKPCNLCQCSLENKNERREYIITFFINKSRDAYQTYENVTNLQNIQ